MKPIFLSGAVSKVSNTKSQANIRRIGIKTEENIDPAIKYNQSSRKKYFIGAKYGVGVHGAVSKILGRVKKVECPILP